MKIRHSPSGTAMKMATGYFSFIPNILPPNIEWNTTLVNALSRADHLLGKLSREGAKLPNPHLLMRPFIAREAVLSSKIEGTQATIGEVLANEAGILTTPASDDLLEVHNYITALEYGLARLNNFPLSLRVLKEIHEKLMQGVRGSHATPGEFRSSQNWIGAPGSLLNTAKYVPPPPDHLQECLSHFESFLHDRQFPPLVHIALCHYQFEAIHPFLDGNGRMGRLLITLLLIEHQLLPSPLLYLSAFFEASRDEYYRQLFNVSAEGTWQEWLIYFFNGVSTQSADVLSRAERINELINLWQIQLAGSSSRLALDVISLLAVNPFFTLKIIAKNFDVAYTTAQRAIRKLEALQIIRQVALHKREQIYCASAILSILEEEAKIDHR